MISRTGHVLLADFGFAQSPTLLRPSLEEFREWRGRSCGTPGYMAPEVWQRPSSHCTARSDVFSLGMVFLELMAGRYTPVWDTHDAPPGWVEGSAAWTALSGRSKHVFVANRDKEFSSVSEEAVPRDSTEWDLCITVRSRPVGSA